MIVRRSLLVSAAAMLACPRASALLPPSAASLRGTHEQGGLMVGKADPAARVNLDGKALQISPQGWFVFGVAYDRIDRIVCSVTNPDGSVQDLSFAPITRQYDIQAINGLPDKYVEPPADILERMERERALIKEARARDSDGIGFSRPLEWPCAGRLSGIYGSQRILNGEPRSPHLGVDVAAPEGTPIHAAADAVVAISDEFYLEGGFTLLDHGHGVNTCYLHQSKRLVAAGDKVKSGDIIGHIGHTGRATGPHTHWGLCWFQLKLDPSRATASPEPPKA